MSIERNEQFISDTLDHNAFQSKEVLEIPLFSSGNGTASSYAVPVEPECTKDTFTIKDSGARQTFESGMVRDTQDNKADFTRVLDGPMFDRWATHLTKGEKKYPDVKPGIPNWTLAAGEAELIRFKKSAFRHFRQWMRGDRDEDHASACFFNINGAEYVKEKLNGKA